MRQSGRPTIKDLASRAGVSKTAVSFAFNSPERISKETYQKIMDIAKELGYVPDPVARGLARRKTQCIGILLPQPRDHLLGFIPRISRDIRLLLP